MTSIMENAKTLVTFLGHILGSNCEIVLQDVKQSKIVAIANGQVSGRSINAPLTDLALKMIADKTWENQDYELNYSGITSDGRILRSSTYFLKEKGKLIGMLCINVDTSKYEELSNQILALGGITDMLVPTSSQPPAPPANEKLPPSVKPSANHKTSPIETFSESISDIVDKTINKCLHEKGHIPVSRLTQDEKLEIISALNNQGVFLLKGAISDVAAHLECSDASIYRYLSKLPKITH